MLFLAVWFQWPNIQCIHTSYFMCLLLFGQIENKSRQCFTKLLNLTFFFKTVAKGRRITYCTRSHSKKQKKQSPLPQLTLFLSRGNPSLWTSVLRITAVKDQDIFRSEAAQGSLLQFAKLISSTKACKCRSGPSSGLIGSLRSPLMQVP